jgi:pyridoxamine-phosphate oxidase
VQFARWYAEARRAGEPMPEAMALATVDAEGCPAVRMVLMKRIDRQGILFYTNYRSPKARHLAERPTTSVVFYWPRIERQVRIDGTVARLPAEASDAYFATRPRGSQLGAWASPQSEPIAGREVLVERVAELARQYPGKVPRPPHWGGYRITPTRFEFWQAGDDRLNDRFLYTRAADGQWRRQRLAP